MSKINIIDHKPNQTKPTQKPMIIHHDNDGQLLPFFFFFSLPSFTTYIHTHINTCTKHLLHIQKKKNKKKTCCICKKVFLYFISVITHTHTLLIYSKTKSTKLTNQIWKTNKQTNLAIHPYVIIIYLWWWWWWKMTGFCMIIK